MPLSLNTIKPGKKSSKNRKRIGRGNASGHGTYSTKGQKGQKSRSGVSNLKRLGMKSTLLSTPKNRGFKSLQPKAQVVSFAIINKFFKDKDTINPSILLKKKLIDTLKADVKILGGSDLNRKGLVIENIKTSLSAKEQIEKLGGELKNTQLKK
jgi:large subunit ribosomal protein L15